MSTQSREALRLLVSALETHLDAIATRHGATDTGVDDAYDAVAEAFESYEEALDVEFAETVPLVLVDDDDDEYDEDGQEVEDGDDAEVVGGEDDEEIDPHAEEDEDDMDDDLDDFDLR